MIETRVLADSSIVCRPSGRVDWTAALSLRQAIGDSLRPGGDVVIDLRRVEFIDAVGMSAMVGAPGAGGGRPRGDMRCLAGGSASLGTGRRLPAGEAGLRHERP